jgi:hypothetical protein
VERLRKPPFVAALVLLALVVAVELGAVAAVGAGPPDRAALTALAREQGLAAANAARAGARGLSVPALALLDAPLLLNAGLMAAALFAPASIQGRIQGAALLVAAIVNGLACAAVGLLAVARFPIAAFLPFHRGAATAALGLILVLKVASGACLLAAQPRFAQNRTLLLVWATSAGATVILGGALNAVPAIAAGTADAIGALVLAIVAGVWAIVMGARALPALQRAIAAPP